MILAFLCTLVVGICAIALIGLEDSHYRVTRLMQELDHRGATPSGRSRRESEVTAPDVDFTRSLLALSKVDSLLPCDFPAPARDGSSLSGSIPPDRSKSRAQAL